MSLRLHKAAPPDRGHLMDAQQVADWLHISKRTVYRMVPHVVKLGSRSFWWSRDVEDFLEERRAG